MCAAVSHSHDLVELMGDEQDGLALLLEPAHDLHQFVDLLRGQHSGRLVKDQDLVVAVQHLQNLYALLHTHRDIADECVRVYPQTVAIVNERNRSKMSFAMTNKKDGAGNACGCEAVIMVPDDFRLDF